MAVTECRKPSSCGTPSASFRSLLALVLVTELIVAIMMNVAILAAIVVVHCRQGAQEAGEAKRGELVRLSSWLDSREITDHLITDRPKSRGEHSTNIDHRRPQSISAVCVTDNRQHLGLTPKCVLGKY